MRVNLHRLLHNMGNDGVRLDLGLLLEPFLLTSSETSMNALLSRFLLLVFVFLQSAGCVANKSVLGHRVALEGATREALIPDKDFVTWRSRYDGANSDFEKMYYRNLIIRRLMLKDDEYFTAWSQQLYGGRAVANTTADMATGVLSAFVAASGGGASSQTIGLILSGISATRLALDKNIYLEKTAGALISTMHAGRADVDTQITQYLKNSVLAYSLEDGLRDVVRYYEAGTLAHASESLHSEAKESAREAEALTEYEKGDRKVAPRVLEQASASAFQPQRYPEFVPRRSSPPPGLNNLPEPNSSELKTSIDKVVGTWSEEKRSNQENYRRLLKKLGFEGQLNTPEELSNKLEAATEIAVLKEVLAEAEAIKRES